MKTNKNLYAVILAGGSGTRFWPLSRQTRPKQFLQILGQDSLFHLTLKRIKAKIPSGRIYVVTNQKYANMVIHQAKSFNILKANILLEPAGKNTAPAICWAAARIYQKNKDAVMAVLPADHLIARPLKFLGLLDQAVIQAQRHFLVTFGIVPTRPETGYGYIKAHPAGHVWKVEKFIEKPNLTRAEKFFRTKGYFWNSGMFVWSCADILNSFYKYLPKAFSLLLGGGDAAIKRGWHKLPNISIDYGILEKARNVAVIPAKDIGWSDLGSWESLSEVLAKDSRSNILKGDIFNLDSSGTFVLGDKRLIATVGLKDLIIVDTDDALLVCRKDMSQKVKEVVEALKNMKRNIY